MARLEDAVMRTSRLGRPRTWWLLVKEGDTPSDLRWKAHGLAPVRATGLSVPCGACTRTSVNAVREDVNNSALAAWFKLTVQPSYMGRKFLHLEQLDGELLRLTTVKGGPWIRAAGTEPTLMAQLTRCLTGHAPIGEYYERFNIPEPTRCDCGAPLQTRTHVICACPSHKRKPMPGQLHSLVGFLRANPLVFAFAPRD